ncbi:MAG: carboxy terminal-processing peptidase [Acidiferrobacterales bacterium]|nr:carboxy terminal-processing peptidase [Acidiferrobacterales bacterium]
MERTKRSRRPTGVSGIRSFAGQIVLIGLLASYFVYLIFFHIIDTDTASAESDSLTPVDYHSIASIATAKMAQGLHYNLPKIDNQASPDILESYLTTLDPTRAFLRQSDIDEFRQHELYFDDFLIGGNLDVVFEIFERYRERVNERMAYALSMLDYQFDFNLTDELANDRSDAEWPKNIEAQDWLWKRLVKDDVLTLVLEGNTETYQDVLKSRYERRLNNVSQYRADDVTELFLNAYLRKLDPYSAYFSSNSTEDLEITLSQQIEGIGAVLVLENDFTVIHSLITGGPAQRSNLINEGDRIVAVKGENDEFHDIVGWRLSNVVDLIRGPKGTYVTLKIIPQEALSGSLPVEVTILRDKVKIEDQMARKSTVEIVEDDRLLQLGIIELPAFYASLYPDDNQDSVRTSARDVAMLLKQLNDQQVDGVLIDLRGNGGGALSEAVDLTSLFIESGPIVQVESTDGELEIRFDSTGKVTYDGPLVVLVDRQSASGSEIFAGAVQDYGRGVIVGETTFGKGMLQTIWPLDRVAKTEHAGTLKLSTAKFYRVNGESTHYHGVVPDIPFATDEFAQDSGERSNENSTPGTNINRAKQFEQWQSAPRIRELVPSLSSRSEERTEMNPVVDYLVTRERNSQRRFDQSTIYLNKEKRESVIGSEREIDLRALNDLRLAMGWESATELSEDTVPTDLIEDTFRDEALNILVDLIIFQMQAG